MNHTVKEVDPRPINIALLDAAIEQIELHPETWQQRHWRCETGMCVAGWIVTLAGDEWASAPGLGAEEFVRVNGRLVHAEIRAMKLLGISFSPALFDAENTLEDIKRFRDEMAEGYVRAFCDLEDEGDDEDDDDHDEDGDW